MPLVLLFAHAKGVPQSQDFSNLPHRRSLDGMTRAVATFPDVGVSSDSDAVAAAIRNGLVRGASVGFTPVRWSLSKDPARPFGVNFEQITLHEWSVCSVPCNQDCLFIGASSSKSMPVMRAPLSRSERLAEAKRLRRSICG
jgi:HK97 family phage prohead protease